MKVKDVWRKKNVKHSAATNKGLEGLLGVHIKALEDNSDNIVELLEVLSERKDKLSIKELNQIKKMKKELNSIDKRIDSLGNKQADTVEEDYFEF